MEAYDQGHGCILYRTKIRAGGVATLEAAAIHDFGFVFLMAWRGWRADRRRARASLLLPERNRIRNFDIPVEPDKHQLWPGTVDPKGIIAPVKLGGKF